MAIFLEEHRLLAVGSIIVQISHCSLCSWQVSPGSAISLTSLSLSSLAHRPFSLKWHFQSIGRAVAFSGILFSWPGYTKLCRADSSIAVGQGLDCWGCCERAVPLLCC